MKSTIKKPVFCVLVRRPNQWIWHTKNFATMEIAEAVANSVQCEPWVWWGPQQEGKSMVTNTAGSAPEERQKAGV